MNRKLSHEKLESYNTDWPKKYEEEAEKIREILGDKLLQIEHIGSTSIPNLVSKPIIDIGAMVETPEHADDSVEKLEKLGYYFDHMLHKSNPNAERHFFRKYEGPINYHLSLAYKTRGGFLERQILFRDYLRNHDDTRDEYAQLKKELMEKDSTGQDSYIGGKTEFVTNVLRRAGFEGKHIN